MGVGDRNIRMCVEDRNICVLKKGIYVYCRKEYMSVEDRNICVLKKGIYVC